MNKSFLIKTAIVMVVIAVTSCQKKEENTSSTNIATEVVANLNAISANYSPNSLASASSRMARLKADPCQGVSDFAVCQSNLIREYNAIGKNVVDTIGQLVGQLGSALGQIPDGSAGSASSTNGSVSWNRVSASQWSTLFKNTSNQSQSYVSVSGNTYTLKFDRSVDTSDPLNQQIEAVVNFTSTNAWTVDVYFANLECDAADPSAPNKFQLRLGFDGSLWTGKAMLYAGRWKGPAATVTCSTTYGDAANEIAMYTDYVGNDTSTKASLYMIPASNNNLGTISNFDIPDFCTNFASNCGGMGEPANAGALASYANPWCTTGPGTTPTWGNTCPSNAPVSAGSYSDASNWIVPSALKTKTVTLPASL